MLVERDWKTMSGRWFTGAYDETGIDVKLVEAGGEPVVFGASVTALKTGPPRPPSRFSARTFRPVSNPKTSGSARASRWRASSRRGRRSSRSNWMSLRRRRSASRDVSIAGTVKPSALAVFDKIDGIKVLPQAGMARVGGNVFPKQMQQFEAVGINYGPDGKPDTADDFNLGLVKVKWSLEEYTATFGDDDLRFVGTLDQTGLFTPNVDGPNPKRDGNRNNIGDVWVVAEFDPAPVRDRRAPRQAAARACAPAGHRPAVHGVVRKRGGTMTSLGRAGASSIPGGGEAVCLPGPQCRDLRAGRGGRHGAADA